VRVPDEAGLGVAKVTFSFNAWKDVKVKASTIELRVEKPEQAERSPEVKK
jgi:hypothetical protein